MTTNEITAGALCVCLFFMFLSCVPEKSGPTIPPPPDDDDGSPVVAAEFTAWMQDNARVINSLDLFEDGTDLLPVTATLDADTRLVAIGQTADGSREMMRLRNRLARQLIVENDFTLVLMEVPWTDGCDIDAYINGGDEDIEAILASRNGWWLKCTEMADFFNWLRDYNTNSTHALHVYGTEATRPGEAMDRVLDFLSVIDPELAAWAGERYACFREYENDPAAYAAVNDAAQDSCEAKLQAVQDTLIALEDTLVAQSSATGYGLALQAAAVAAQGQMLFRRGVSISATLSHQAMIADNIDWAMGTDAANVKAVFLAHNFTAANYPDLIKTTGAHLRERYGQEVVIWGSTAGTGQYWTHASDGVITTIGNPVRFSAAVPPDESYENYLSTAEISLYFLSFDNIDDGDSFVTNWLFDYRSLRNFTTFYNARLAMEFDGFFWIEESTTSSLIE